MKARVHTAFVWPWQAAENTRDFPACARRSGETAQSTDSSINPRSAGNLLPTAANFSEPPGEGGIAAGWWPTVIVLLLTKQLTGSHKPSSPRKSAGIWSYLFLRPELIPSAAPLKNEWKKRKLLHFRSVGGKKNNVPWFFERHDERTDSFWVAGQSCFTTVCGSITACPFRSTKRLQENMATRLQMHSSWSTVKHSKGMFSPHPNYSMETFNLFLRVTEEETIRSLCRESQPTVYQTKYISGWNGLIWTCVTLEDLSKDSKTSYLKVGFSCFHLWRQLIMFHLWILSNHHHSQHQLSLWAILNWNIPYLEAWVVPRVSKDSGFRLITEWPFYSTLR